MGEGSLQPGVETALVVGGRILRAVKIPRAGNGTAFLQVQAQFEVVEIVLSAHRFLGVKKVSGIN